MSSINFSLVLNFVISLLALDVVGIPIEGSVWNNRWSWRAIKSFAMGELEARKLKYPTTGTEAILMGILIEGISLSVPIPNFHFCVF